MAQDVVYCSDTLSDLLVSVDLDIYISQSTSEFGAKEQQGGTCYANASAAVLHLAMKRILGREGGYPDFNIKDKMIKPYKICGVKGISKVLQDICPQYRLHSQKVDIKGAIEAIVKKRPVVARFGLTEDEWMAFQNFFKNASPTGILTQNELVESSTSHIWSCCRFDQFQQQVLDLHEFLGTRLGRQRILPSART